ncbi:SMP-30/gluconolactonase/LRE family protein [Segetibacter sp. 3557_3]|uniref:SMP-30/gluconolactonase/LRE family protein n=1 Tax=Segetibacter sp. 3557_3 TaxID=2547429 RepID=UPI00105895CF|nr:SMP-30/gluconolactonase/LRE family protein [Segetibacter sp. 3557_3]TDH28716.1 SMP-30/gluconolactonase/LRE family protein [Segetibacter sp. 3557_3]
MNRHLIILPIFLSLCLAGVCQDKFSAQVVKFNPKLDAIISENAEVEVIAEGFLWCEGPLWLEKEQMLLFSDVPANTIYKWTKQKGKEVYLTPSGYTGTIKRGGETGSNGLLLNRKGQLILCQHGDRRIALMDAPLKQPAPKFITLANLYNNKKFDSPNDAVVRSNGDIYFTDPPYGLERNVRDTNKAAPYQGVYKVDTKGKVTLLTDTITRPNGIAFFPGEKKILIANSDPRKPYWYIYDISKDRELTNGRIFYDATNEAKTERGAPDGLKIDKKGNVFATGPGGVWIFDSNGNVLGKIKVNDLTSNCAISKDGTLYITANRRVLKVKLK